MPQTPPKKNDPAPVPEPERDDPTWAADQKNRGYYYDDSTGYRKYDPEAEDDEDEESEREKAD